MLLTYLQKVIKMYSFIQRHRQAFRPVNLCASKVCDLGMYSLHRARLISEELCIGVGIYGYFGFIAMLLSECFYDLVPVIHLKDFFRIGETS